MQNQLKSMYIYITTRCNLRCPHCWVTASNEGIRAILSLKDYMSFIDKNIPLGLRYIKITGGEPLLRKEVVFGLIKFCKDKGIHTALESNGTLINERDIKQLKSLGLSEIAISLDSSEYSWHDEFRGKLGAFNRTVRTIKNCVSLKIPVTVLMVVLKNNLREVNSMVEFALQKLGAHKIKVTPCIEIGRAHDIQSDLLEPQEYLELITRLIKLAKQFPNRVASMVPWALANPVDNLDLAFGKCDITSIIGLLPNGGVSICGIGITQPESIFANSLSDDPAYIWETAGNLVQLSSKTKRFSGICGACLFQHYCANICPAYAYEVYRSFVAPFPTCQILYETGRFPTRWIVSEVTPP
ncbi:MAG: Antilisterial bacteriocin subtilosin biosynthesis protein AlbA [candidate division WS2 bacterium]|nr:Antilisterial bacteriocin subtilosin biosynthesis protein AlbA [Candidatus Lithacetigena glycinireducens]